MKRNINYNNYRRKTNKQRIIIIVIIKKKETERESLKTNSLEDKLTNNRMDTFQEGTKRESQTRF
jgi:hypothetical protein